MDAIPHYNNLDITKYDTIYGVYTLGFIKKHFPNIGIIDPSYFIGDKCENLDLWLENKIKSMLQKYEKVCIIPYEEDIFYFVGAYSKIVNKFVNEELYHITLLNTYNDDWLLLYEEYNIKLENQKTKYKSRNKIQIRKNEELQESFLAFLETDWEDEARIIKEIYEADPDKKSFSNYNEMLQ